MVRRRSWKKMYACLGSIHLRSNKKFALVLFVFLCGRKHWYFFCEINFDKSPQGYNCNCQNVQMLNFHPPLHCCLCEQILYDLPRKHHDEPKIILHYKWLQGLCCKGYWLATIGSLHFKQQLLCHMLSYPRCLNFVFYKQYELIHLTFYTYIIAWGVYIHRCCWFLLWNTRLWMHSLCIHCSKNACKQPTWRIRPEFRTVGSYQR